MKIDDDKSRAPAVDSAIKILELLSNSPHPLTLSEICSELNIPNSTGHRILNELQSKNMVDYDATRVKAYCLGSQIFIMTSAVYNKQRLIPYFQPIAKSLKHSVNLPVILTIPIGRNVVVIAKIEPESGTYPEMFIGKTMPMHASAAGKAMLSMKANRYIDNYLKHAALEACTAATITDIETLKQDINHYKQLGYAISEHEYSMNLSAIAVPILNLNNESIAAISIYHSDHDHILARQQELSQYLIDAAKLLETRLNPSA